MDHNATYPTTTSFGRSTIASKIRCPLPTGRLADVQRLFSQSRAKQLAVTVGHDMSNEEVLQAANTSEPLAMTLVLPDLSLASFVATRVDATMLTTVHGVESLDVIANGLLPLNEELEAELRIRLPRDVYEPFPAGILAKT